MLQHPHLLHRKRLTLFCSAEGGHSPFVLMAVVKHPHDEAGGDGDEDEKHQRPADRTNDDAGVLLRKSFCRKTRPASGRRRRGALNL